MAGFTKLWSFIVNSTVWNEDHPTRIVWVTMLALKDQHGDVLASIPGLAHQARVTVPECELALAKFQQPDPYSRCQDHEGRRIGAIEGGWHLLNHDYYRRLGSEDQARACAAERARRYRERKRAAASDASPKVTQERDASRCVTPRHKKSRYTDTDTESKSVSNNKHNQQDPSLPHCAAGVPHGVRKVTPEVSPAAPGTGSQKTVVRVENDPRYSDAFKAFWAAYPNKRAPQNAWREWERARKGGRLPTLEYILSAVTEQKTSSNWRRGFVKDPERWIKGDCWHDQRVPAPVSTATGAEGAVQRNQQTLLEIMRKQTAGGSDDET